MRAARHDAGGRSATRRDAAREAPAWRVCGRLGARAGARSGTGVAVVGARGYTVRAVAVARGGLKGGWLAGWAWRLARGVMSNIGPCY